LTSESSAHAHGAPVAAWLGQHASAARTHARTLASMTKISCSSAGRSTLPPSRASYTRVKVIGCRSAPHTSSSDSSDSESRLELPLPSIITAAPSGLLSMEA
jgi:hypothetical protein